MNRLTARQGGFFVDFWWWMWENMELWGNDIEIQDDDSFAEGHTLFLIKNI